MNDRSITCERLDELLPDYLEDALDVRTRSVVDEHAASCARCGALIADLQAITLEARALPALEPPRDLWDGIATRIEAPVVALDAPREARRSRSSRWRLAAAAAALVVMTAGVTYTVTVNAVVGSREVAADRQADGRPGGQLERPAPERSAVTVAADNTPAESARRVDGRELSGDSVRLAITPPSTRVEAQRKSVRPPRGGTSIRNASTQPAEVTYDREIKRLRGILEARRSRLDPATVTVIEYNLKVIDDAIAQSRAALAKDPASGFLSEQLNTALDKKLTLLRTAALLSART